MTDYISRADAIEAICGKCGGCDEKPYDFCPNCGARMKGGDDEWQR